ncbi:EAL domain-containing protein [Gluconobacter sp. Dm-74]|uniref:putative bifunctional diguanylate cyclase/phosphodiesterase n=1 Tax=Gluconobacter sp. Dm-74 TaxID=2799803 RepID=UPI001B8B962B|nr:EAL domain-containing protein [Gluconobacter sp. Dm-74]MBS1090077.1 EAL domain-containing protein [Gluconobacter sp. Dm-74]
MKDDRQSGAGSSAGGERGSGVSGAAGGQDGPCAEEPDRRASGGTRLRRWFRQSLVVRWAVLGVFNRSRSPVLKKALVFQATQVPAYFQTAFNRGQLRSLRLLFPIHLLAQAVSAPVVALGVWSSSWWLALFLFVGIEGALLLWFSRVQPNIRSMRSFADYAAIRRALRVLNGALGLVWFVFIILVFRLHCEDIHLLTLGVCFGLMAPLLLCAPVSGAVEAMVVPIIAGAYGALLEGCFYRSVLFTASFFLMATVCGLFVVGINRLVGVLLWRMQMARLKQREQADILSLLTRRSAAPTGRWLWETDEAGVLRNPSAGLCRILGRDETQIAGRTLASLLEIPAASFDQSGSISSERHLAYCLTHRLAFRELVVRAVAGSDARWWMLTGEPVFRGGVFRGYLGVGADVTALQRVRERHFHRVRHDALTGLPNRLACQEHLQKRLLETMRGAQAFVVVLISLDVSSLGRRRVVTPDEAAEVLQKSLSRLKACLARNVPAHLNGAEGCFVARYGAMDLAVVTGIPVERKRQFLEALALEILLTLSGAVSIAGDVIDVEPAIGMAVSTTGDGEVLVEAVETALRDARGERVGRYSIFDPCEEMAGSRQQSLFRDVRQALRQKAFALVYQPIVNAQTGMVIGFEALSRWKGAGQRNLSIGKVIDTIAETGGGLEFDFWVLENACRAARRWPVPLWVSVNMTATHFSLPDIAGRIFQVLAHTGLEAHRLQIEVTETQALEVGPRVHHAFRELEFRGVGIALDDFGKGFSTLMYLRQFPFSKIKLDAAFIQDMLQDARSAAVVRNVIALGRDLGVAVTAEGVSSPEHCRHLQEQGCTEVQGFYLGRPVPEEDVPLFWGRRVADLS